MANLSITYYKGIILLKSLTMRKLLCLIFAILLLHGVTIGQNRVFHDARKLTCSLISRVFQDGEGYMWIGTEYGLNRFDGHSFRKYFPNEADTTSLLSNNVRTLYLDQDSTLWVGTNLGVQRYQAAKDNFHTVPFENDKSMGIIQFIRMAEDNALWVVTTGRGIYRLDQNSDTLRFHEIKGLPFEQNQVRRLFIDHRGNNWYATSNSGLWRKSAKDGAWSQMLTGAQVGFINQDGGGHVYALQRGNLYRLDEMNDAFERIPLTQGLDVRDFTPLQNGDLLITTFKDGIFLIDSRQGEIKPYLQDIPNAVTTLEDKDGNLWVGSLRRGLDVFPCHNSQFEFTDFGAPITTITSTCDGEIWAGADNGKLYRMDDSGNVKSAVEFKSGPVSLLPIDDGDMLVGLYYDGLARYNPESGAITYDSALDGMRIKSIVHTSDGRIFLAAFSRLVMEYEPSKHTVLPLPAKLKDKYFNVLMVDNHDYLWIGHYKGVDVYDTRTGELIAFPMIEDSISSYATNALLQDSKGRVWIGTNHSLWRYDPDKNITLKFGSIQGLSNDMICGLSEDSDHNIWVSTFNGLDKIDKNDQVTSYYALGEKEFTRGAYNQQGGPKKATLFGGIHGVTLVDSNFDIPPLVNRKVIVTNMPMRPNKEIHVEGENFTLDFSILDFTAPDGLSYEFRVLDKTKEWASTSPGVNSVTFSGLGYGKHKIEVRAIENGIATESQLFTIVVPTPWYWQWWMILIYGLIIAGMGWIIYRAIYHHRQAEETERRMRFFINIAHDLRSPLTLIASPVEKMMSRSETYDNDTNRALRTIHRNTYKIIGMLNQLLDIRRIDKGQLSIEMVPTDMVELLTDIHETFLPEAEKHRIAFTFLHEGMDHLPALIDPQCIDRVVVNLLSNAFKFTPDGGNVSVRLKSEGVNMTIEVEDNGEGINEGEQRRIFDRFYQGGKERRSMSGFGIGLNLCKLLVELHQGKITAQRIGKDGGSRFIVTLPRHENQLSAITPTVAEKPIHSFLISEPTEEERAKRKASAPKHPYRILIVDDDDDLRDFLITEMADNFRTSGCRNGMEALSMATAQIPDLIVTDIVMPEMDGLTLLKSLKSNSATTHIPVIMLTTRGDQPDRLKGLEYGADAYLSKPFVLDELIALASNLIAGRQLLKGKYSGLHDQEASVTIESKSSDELLMERMMKVINEHFDDPDLNTESLAAEVGLSRVQLHRRLRDMMGMSTSDFVRNVRFKKAEELLADNKMTIAEVTYAVGYSNTAHFSTAFKRQYGMTPSQFRQRAQQQSNVAETKE